NVKGENPLSGVKVISPSAAPQFSPSVLLEKVMLVTSTVCISDTGHAPPTVYSTVYVAPGTSLLISPVVLLIVAPSVGTGLKAKVPPAVTTLVGPLVLPSQKSLKSNPASAVAGSARAVF